MEQEQTDINVLPSMEQLNLIAKELPQLDTDTEEELSQEESKKEPVKYYVVSTIQYVANSRKELREYMNNFDPEYTMIIRGNETIMKKRVVYSF